MQKLHENEFSIDRKLVRKLLRDQFACFSSLDMQRIRTTGTVNVIYRLGNDVAIRFPRSPEYSSSPLREWEWLSFFSSRLPLCIPEPVGIGQPTAEYPAHWLIVRWISGDNATRTTLRSIDAAAVKLGRFVTCLRSIDTEGATIPHYRGRSLRLRDRLTREAINKVADEFDQKTLRRAWDRALQTSEWTETERFFHGDLHAGNLISSAGELCAVIDFGGIGTGDPSVDGIPGWWVFDNESRKGYREAGEFDDSTWDRARGWALSVALIALPYYRESNPLFADMARIAIGEVLSDDE
jgi:aminoglycoside phosphotransferase (APT) family kinase protein